MQYEAGYSVHSVAVKDYIPLKSVFWFQTFTSFLNERNTTKQLRILAVNVNYYVSKMRRLTWVILTALWQNKTVLIFVIFHFIISLSKILATTNNFVFSMDASVIYARDEMYQVTLLRGTSQRKYISITTFELFIFTQFSLLWITYIKHGKKGHLQTMSFMMVKLPDFS